MFERKVGTRINGKAQTRGTDTTALSVAGTRKTKSAPIKNFRQGVLLSSLIGGKFFCP
jgi:hypothetical protein